MSDPKRFSASRDLKGTLLASAKRDRPPRGAHSKALVAASAAITTGAQVSSAAAGVSLLGRLAASKWAVMGAVGLGAAATASAYIASTSAPPLDHATSSTQSTPGRSASSTTRPEPSRSGAESTVPMTALVAPSAPPRSPSALPSAVHEALPVSHPVSQLAREITVLDEARHVLANGDPAEAVRKIDAYRVSFPTGMLFAEATGLRIEALARIGREDEAREELARLKSQSPDSPVLDNLLRVVGEPR